MVNLNIEETSGVDHPAHLSEGWVVMKNATTEDVQETFSEIEESNMTEEQELDQIVELQDALLKAEARIEELEKAAKAVHGDMDEDEADKKKKKKMMDEDEDLMKAAPEAVRKMVDDLRAEAEEAMQKAQAATEELAKERIAKADAEAVARVKAWESLSLDADEVGPALRKLSEVDADLAKSIEGVLSSVNGQAESANIFAEIGNSNASTGTTAYESLSNLAKAAVEDGSAKTFEQAFVEVATANPDLYAQHLAEGR
jgi:chromosome segregation ATPase